VVDLTHTAVLPIAMLLHPGQPAAPHLNGPRSENGVHKSAVARALQVKPLLPRSSGLQVSQLHPNVSPAASSSLKRQREVIAIEVDEEEEELPRSPAAVDINTEKVVATDSDQSPEQRPAAAAAAAAPRSPLPQFQSKKVKTSHTPSTAAPAAIHPHHAAHSSSLLLSRRKGRSDHLSQSLLHEHYSSKPAHFEVRSKSPEAIDHSASTSSAHAAASSSAIQHSHSSAHQSTEAFAQPSQHDPDDCIDLTGDEPASDDNAVAESLINRSTQPDVSLSHLQPPLSHAHRPFWQASASSFSQRPPLMFSARSALDALQPRRSTSQLWKGASAGSGSQNQQRSSLPAAASGPSADEIGDEESDRSEEKTPEKAKRKPDYIVVEDDDVEMNDIANTGAAASAAAAAAAPAVSPRVTRHGYHAAPAAAAVPDRWDSDASESETDATPSQSIDASYSLLIGPRHQADIPACLTEEARRHDVNRFAGEIEFTQSAKQHYLNDGIQLELEDLPDWEQEKLDREAAEAEARQKQEELRLKQDDRRQRKARSASISPSTIHNQLRKLRHRRSDSESSSSDADRGGRLYEVETILCKKLIRTRKARNGDLSGRHSPANFKYLVAWKGYPPDQNTFEPYKNVSDVLSLMSAYEREAIPLEEEYRTRCDAIHPPPAVHGAPAASSAAAACSSSPPLVQPRARRHHYRKRDVRPMDTDEDAVMLHPPPPRALGFSPPAAVCIDVVHDHILMSSSEPFSPQIDDDFEPPPDERQQDDGAQEEYVGSARYRAEHPIYESREHHHLFEAAEAADWWRSASHPRPAASHLFAVSESS
jgi:hypothetical protein